MVFKSPVFYSSREKVLNIQRKINRFYHALGMQKRIEEDGIAGKQTIGAVREVQRLLKLMNFYNARIDGIWGKKTEAAFSKFMNKYGKVNYELGLKMERFYFMLNDRYNYFISALSLIPRKYNVKIDEVIEYLEKNENRIKEIFKYLVSLFPSKENIIGEVVLSSFIAEKLFNIDAGFLLSLAFRETHFSNVFGINGKGIMQLTSNSSLSHLKGKWLDKVHEMLGKNIIKERVLLNEVPIITFNVLAGAETVLLKLAEMNAKPEMINKENLQFVMKLAERYNGHPQHKHSYSRKVLHEYKKLKGRERAYV